jgi:hypothetical protein
MEDLKLLKEHLHELEVRRQQLIAIRDRIEVESWRDTKRLLSVGITELQTATFYIKAAIEAQERIPSQRYS